VLDTVDVSLFRRAALIYSLFILLLYGLMYFINKAWKYANSHGALYDPNQDSKDYYQKLEKKKKAGIVASKPAPTTGPYNPMAANSSAAAGAASIPDAANSNIDDILSYDPAAASTLQAAQMDPYSLFTLQQERAKLKQAKLLKKSDLMKQQDKAQQRTRQILGLDEGDEGSVVTIVNVVPHDKHRLN
jgi:hypothetical protein